MKVYIAGPITKGDTVVNVRTAILAADRVLAAGHVPFVPHLYHFWHFLSPHSYDDWMRLDDEWLRMCEALIRLPGESAGSDIEVQVADGLGLPIFEGVDEFLDWAAKQ